MGLFKAIKEFISFRKKLKNSMQKFEKNLERYPALTTDELKELPEDELFSAVLTRTEKAVDDFGDTYEDMVRGIEALPEKQRIFYSVNYLDCEVNNGGLCQFFTNDSRAVAPFISEYLGIIGAADHKELFDRFIKKNNIDVKDLSSFDSNTVDEFLAQYERYPFDEYDDAFYELKPLEKYLTCFIKANINDF